MPKKAGRKGGGGRQAAMTEEERLLYLQQKAQAEEEMAKKKEDMLLSFLKDKLLKEERNTELNLHKLRQQWRAVLIQTKTAELRNDISVLCQTFERVLDCKDNIIRSLVVDLSEREQQSELACSSQLHNVDCLLQLHMSRLEELELNFTTNLEELSSEFNSERDKILRQHQQDSMYLETVMFSTEQHYADLDSEARGDYKSTKHQIKKQNKEDKHVLQAQMEGMVDRLWRQLKHALHAYNEATEDKFIATDALQLKDEQSTKEIDTHKKRIQKMQDVIAALRSQLSSSQTGTEDAVQKLCSDHDELNSKVQHLRAQLSVAQTGRRQQLTNLTIQSSNAAKQLQEIIAKGEMLLRLSEMCRKLETEHEKVLPFYASSLNTAEMNQERADAIEPPSEKLAQLMLDYSPLEKFWQRYNKVQLEYLCLKREKSVLELENDQLRIHLKQYLDGIWVSDESLHQYNSLLMVSSPSLQAPSETSNQKHYVVQEAANIARQRL